MAAAKLLVWWRAPLWLLALATGAKSFIDNPILGSRRLNGRGLHVARLKLAHRMAWWRRRRLAAAVPEEWRRGFDKDGFVEIRDFLPPEAFARLRTFILDQRFDCRQQQQGNTITRRVPVGPELLEAIPELKALRKRWRPLLAYVASTRSEPLYYIQTVCSSFVPGPPDPQLELHSDTFHPSLKAWLFLTDVRDGQAPLTYVAGSHRLTSERLAWEHARSIAFEHCDRLSQRGSLRVTAGELPSLDLPPPTRLTVPANTLVAIDTYGFHARGASDSPAIRVEIWAYARRSPFLPWAGFDPLSWKPLASRRAAWFLRIVDLLDGLGLTKQHWQPAARRRPIDP